MLSMPHMIVLFIVVLVVFGPHKLPELARGLGKLMAEFRKASTDFRSAFEEEMREMERQALQAERKKAAEAAASSAAGADSVASPAGSGSVGTEAPPNEAQAEPRSTEDPVIAPVAESVPRSPEEPAERKSEAAAVANSQETSHDHQPPA
jgi:sec-independent protein translocase protein TatB